MADAVAVRFNVFGHKSDGYIHNVLLDDYYANDGAWGGRAQVLFQLSDRAKLTLSGDYRRDNFNSALPEVIVDRGVPGFAPVVPGPYTTINDQVPIEKRRIKGLAATFDYVFPNDYTLSSVSAYRSARIFDYLENDNDKANKVDLEANEREKHFTQELRLTSPGGHRFDYVLGAFYINQEAGVDKSGYIGPPSRIHIVGQVDTESYALFGDGQLHMTSDLTLGVGLRYTHEYKKLVGFAQDTSPSLVGNFPNFAPVSDSRSSNSVSPVISFSYKLSDDATAYVKATRGFKSGGWNADFTSIPTAPITTGRPLRFDDEKLTSYEAGLKTRLFDRRLTFNVATFYMDYKNQQVQQRDGVRFLINNAGSSRVYGIETDFALRVTDALSVTGGGGYLNAKYKSFKACTAALADCSGNRLSDAPKFTADLAVDWSRTLGNGQALSAHADYTYRGNNYTNTPLANPLLLNGYSSNVNLNLAYGPGDQTWKVTLFVNNVFDRANPVGRFLDTLGETGGGTLDQSYAPPRIFGARLNVKLSGS